MSHKQKNDAFSQSLVGLFMLAVLALLVYFTIIISGVDVLKGRERMTISVAFDSVGGLKDHDSVMYRGTKVGSVEEIEVTSSNLIARLSIDASVILRESYKIRICNLSMLGGNYLMLEEGEGNEITKDSCILVGETPSDWMSDVANIAKNLNELTSRAELQSIITNFEAMSISAREIVERVERGEGTVGKLLSEDTKLYDDMRTTLANAAEISERVKSGEGTIGKLLSGDDSLYLELKDGVAAFKSACESLNMGGEVKVGITNVVAKADVLMTTLNTVAARLERGEGTIGKALSDESMYDELNGLIRDMRQILDNYRDTTPISTFGSLATGAL